jgi:hypothetical protein
MSRIDDWREILVAAAALETGVFERRARAGSAREVASDLGLGGRAVRIAAATEPERHHLLVGARR